jgi:hypothetical protein
VCDAGLAAIAQQFGGLREAEVYCWTGAAAARFFVQFWGIGSSRVWLLLGLHMAAAAVPAGVWWGMVGSRLLSASRCFAAAGFALVYVAISGSGLSLANALDSPASAAIT